MESISEKFRADSYRSFFFVLFLISIPLFAICTKWGFDEIHEGQLLLSVKSIESGLVIHRDFFEYKGMLSPYLLSFLHPQSLPLVFSLRIIMVSLILLSSLFAFMYLNRLSKSWAFAISISWLLLSPILMLWSSKPWPNKILIDPGVINTFIVVLCLLLFSQHQRFEHDGSVSYKLFLFTPAILLGLLPWNRIQNLFLSVLALTFVMMNAKLSGSSRMKFLLLYLTALLSPFAYLYLENALVSWYNQIIVTPIQLRNQSSSMVTMTSWQSLTTILTFLIVGSSFLILSLLFSSRLFFLAKLDLSSRFFVLTFFCIFVCYFALKLGIDPTLNNSPFNWVILSIQWLPFGFWHLLVLVALFLIILQIYHSVFSRLSRRIAIRSWFKDFDNKFSFLVAINSILFIYPNVGNLWTSALPVSLFVIKFYTEKNLIIKGENFATQILRNVPATIRMLLLSLSLISYGLILPANSRMVYSYDSPDLKYIVTNRASSVAANDAMYQITSLIGGESNTYIRCPFGLSAFPRVEYLANSPNWGEIVYTAPNRDPWELRNATFLLDCPNSYEGSEFVVPNSFKLVKTIMIENREFVTLYKRRS